MKYHISLDKGWHSFTGLGCQEALEPLAEYIPFENVCT